MPDEIIEKSVKKKNSIVALKATFAWKLIILWSYVEKLVHYEENRSLFSCKILVSKDTSQGFRKSGEIP